MTETVVADEIKKGLAMLQDLAKGHSSKGTPSTESTSMVGQSGPTQIHHTPSNSDPGSWAGSSATAVPQNGATDSIDANGTDYTQAKMMKSIMDKISKGQALNEFEAYFMKSFMEKVDKAVPPAFAKKDDKDEVEKGAAKKGDLSIMHKDDEDEEAKKSLTDFAHENDTVQKGLEVSEFLANWADVMTKSLAVMEERITNRVLRGLSVEAERTAEFQKSLAGAVAQLGNGVAMQAQRLAQVEATPARGPKAAQRVDVIEKSQGGGGAADGLESIEKSLVGDVLFSMVQEGKVAAKEVVNWESASGDVRALTPATRAKVSAHFGVR